MLKLAAEGLSNPEAAAVLGKSIETVKSQKSVLIAKLEARNITHAVAVALRRGLLA